MGVDWAAAAPAAADGDPPAAPTVPLTAIQEQ